MRKIQKDNKTNSLKKIDLISNPQGSKSKKNCVPPVSSTSTSLYTPLEAVCTFPFCPPSILTLRRNIPFLFDLHIYLWKLHIYLSNMTFIFSCDIKDKPALPKRHRFQGSSNGDFDRDETRASSIQSQSGGGRGVGGGGGELREGRMIDPTRRIGELDCMFGPTRPFCELDGSVDPTLPFSELDLPNGRVGRCVRSNSSLRGVGQWVFLCPVSVVRGLE
ncbi:hypothetical protein IGI04_025748 [Brassica rapa subsp. trilocularis]|uniref:Uncharacterized protein n=1 Tax=Brassica rapa subsp. trilocularis TaxID=1813537 RepID=A0ABQ7KWK8_BRACM|nr:hypothetical protein IGI04_025748 [Brassica rapa subsp. trilocularis]